MQPKKDGQRPISAGRCGKWWFVLFGEKGLVKGLVATGDVADYRKGFLSGDGWTDQPLPNCATQMSDTGAMCSVQLSCGECSWGSRVLRRFHWIFRDVPIDYSVWTCVDHWMIECFRPVIGCRSLPPSTTTTTTTATATATAAAPPPPAPTPTPTPTCTCTAKPYDLPGTLRDGSKES